MSQSAWNEVGAQVARSLSYVFHVESLLALSGLAFVLGAVEQVAVLPVGEPIVLFPAVARAIWAAYFYLVLRKAAAGSLRLPGPADLRDSWDALIYPLFQGAIVGLWYWGPLFLAAHWTIGLGPLARQMQLGGLKFVRRRHWVSYVFLGCELLGLPPTLIASAVESRALPLFDPSYGLRLVSRVPGAYLRSYGVLLALVWMAFFMDTLSSLLQQHLPVPLAAPVIGYLVTLWVPLAQARLVGQFAHTWGGQMLQAGPLEPLSTTQ